MYENYPNPYSYVNPYSGLARPQPPIMTQQPNNTFVPVSNINEAKNYMVAYGNSVTFKDENAPYIYTKTAISQMDAPIFKRYRLVEETSEMPVNTLKEEKAMDLSNFITKDEFGALQKELEALKKALGEGDNV